MPTVVTRYINTGSSAGGDGTTNATSGANRAWPSLEHALGELNTAYSSSLVGADVQVELECSGATDDTTAVTNPFPTSDTTRYIHLKVPSADRKTTWDSNVYSYGRAVNFTTALSINTNSIRLTGIQLYHSGNLNVGGNSALTLVGMAGECILDGCKFAKANNTTSSAAVVGNALSGKVVFRNCSTGMLVAGGASFYFAGGISLTAMPNNSEVYVYNHTHQGGTTSVSIAFVAASTGTIARAKNCLSQNVTNDVTITNAATSDTATNHHNTGIDAVFVNNSTDWALQSSDTVARNQGTDLSAVGSGQFQFNWDANNGTRPVGSAWDIGCHEETTPDTGFIPWIIG